MGGSTLYQFTAILTLAVLSGMVSLVLRQPLIIAFLAAGILAGPAYLGIVTSFGQVDLFAHIGISVLLFIVGLRLDLSLIRTTGPVALVTGLGQIILTAALALAIALVMGMDPLSSAYIAMSMSFSSTIIIVKLLSDKREIDSLHGRIALGVLIVQDIVAILCMIGLSTINYSLGQGHQAYLGMAFIVLKGAGLLLGMGFLMRFILPGLLKKLAFSQEMLILFAIAWAMLVSTVSDSLGLSREVGAFLAGVSIASTDYRDNIGSRLISLRDFLLVFFFVDLGTRINWFSMAGNLGRAVAFSLFVLAIKPLIVISIMGAMGYRRRTGFLTGNSLAQVSEFSLILAALGISMGHINLETMGLITLVAVFTILISSYMILYSETLYNLFSLPLKLFERHQPYREALCNNCFIMPRVDVVVSGLGNYGREVAGHLMERGREIIGVDFDPQALDFCSLRNIPVLYGDMGDPETFEYLPLHNSRWVISTIRSIDLNRMTLHHLRHLKYGGKVALTASNQDETELYYHWGADLVLRPFADAAEQAVDALTAASDVLSRKNIGWPVVFREIRLKAGSAFAGHTIRDIPLRSATGVSVVAVSRAGKIFFNPEQEFQLFPYDRIVIIGPPDSLLKAEEIIHHIQDRESEDERDSVSFGEIGVAEGSALAGKSLGQLRFREAYGSTVIGIRRGDDYIISPGPAQYLEPEDRLLVMGTEDAVERLGRETLPDA
jgi:Kef-type K+ transport system membrane component KefB/Trk K+ transport system NAD-binding subunit